MFWLPGVERRGMGGTCTGQGTQKGGGLPSKTRRHVQGLGQVRVDTTGDHLYGPRRSQGENVPVNAFASFEALTRAATLSRGTCPSKTRLRLVRDTGILYRRPYSDMIAVIALHPDEQ